MNINIPSTVSNIIKILESHGFEAYVVGGCVRDSILGRVPNDWDITTDALPEKVMEVFKDIGATVVPTGIKHGTVTVIINNDSYEITTYRIDGEYKDSRRPEEVIFTSKLQEDLARRDFTINAMAFNPKEGLKDYFNGIDDLKERKIKTVRNPMDRFEEDALRMLRAIRFSAQLTFDIEEETIEAIKKLSSNIKNISVERIREEFNKIILSDNPRSIYDLYEYGLLENFLPEFQFAINTKQNNPHHIYTVGEHIIKSMENIDKELILRLTMLLHDIGKPKTITTDENGIDHFYNHPLVSKDMAEDILRRMKYDNNTIAKVLLLVQYHDQRVNSKKSIRKLLSKVEEENFNDLIKVWIADIKAQNPKFIEEKIDAINSIKDKLKEIIESNQCFSLKDLAISGKDLIKLGIKPGKEIGMILNKLLEEVIESPDKNEKEKLIEIVMNMDNSIYS
ncbi:poly(A) polymerase [Clostridium bornimense]|uniref:Poly(A) polymerase n=1 Tax=Clostridium bornimense TaxID=1216932 RepID=W6RVT5_9CLOT|nr:CCA tRNA nucleotidyltransferase [Clostridium bornimense]CDM67719.1 poly(A) polymerase [Clostridium bornimense]